ncbi:hypothetical protein MY5147_002465 [Beauveria neobassiana]
MAETVGVVAAGIAFGEVVIKISSHVFTLKHMWKEFKEMPDSIKQLVEDIEMLGSVLQEMETDMTSSTADGTVWGGGVGSLIVEACRRALNTLSLSVNDVSQEMRASSGIKAALRKGKMVLNKEFWVKTERRLQNVVGRLQIAQHWWLIGSLRLFIPRFRPGHYRMHVLDRLRLATEFSVGHADDLRYLLWIDGKVQKEDIKTLDEMGFPLVNFIASNYTQERALNPEAMPRRVVIEALVCWFLPFGTALYTMLQHQTDSDALSLRQYTRGFSQWRRKVELSLQNWLEDLQRGGVDLKNYGQEEEKIFRQLNIFRSKAFEAESWPLGSSPTTYALIGFNHGPEPKDWEFEWELDTDELVGEFWEHIENQDIRMVGAWVD